MAKLLKYAVILILCAAVCIAIIFIVRDRKDMDTAEVALLDENAGDT